VYKDVAEYWTDSRAAVVLTADAEVISHLVDELGLSPESPVNVRRRQYALALWGEELATYLRLRNAWLPSKRGASEAANLIPVRAAR
jgi:hypothetical protein